MSESSARYNSAESRTKETVHWPATAMLFCSRWLVCAPIFAVVLFIVGETPSHNGLGAVLPDFLGLLFPMLLGWPLMTVVVAGIYYLFGTIAKSDDDWLFKLFQRFLAFWWCMGDPLVYAVGRMYPKLLYGCGFKLWNLGSGPIIRIYPSPHTDRLTDFNKEFTV